MSKKIGIIGAGTAGLHLGLYLRQHDVDVTIFTDRKPEEYRGMRLLNTVAHHAVTIKRENALGVNRWPDESHGYFGHHYFINLPPQPLQFYGQMHSASLCKLQVEQSPAEGRDRRWGPLSQQEPSL